jgi:sec-independent protein translocase protein TatB
MLSIPHIIVIFVVALIIFGPEKLPELARNLGKVMGEFRRATGDLQSTFEGHLRDIERDAAARKPLGSEAMLPPSPFDGIPATTPEGTKPSNAPNAAAIALGNAAIESAVAAAGQSTDAGSAAGPSQEATNNPADNSSSNSSPHSSLSGESSSMAGSSAPEHAPESSFDHVSDAGFHHS